MSTAMAVISEHIRSGLLELRTDSGPLYVRPSLWQLAYLRWMFRHFHVLRQEALSRRQQQMIRKLGESAVAIKSRRIPEIAKVGTIEIENVQSISPPIAPLESAVANPATGAANAALKDLSEAETIFIAVCNPGCVQMEGDALAIAATTAPLVPGEIREEIPGEISSNRSAVPHAGGGVGKTALELGTLCAATVLLGVVSGVYPVTSKVPKAASRAKVHSRTGVSESAKLRSPVIPAARLLSTPARNSAVAPALETSPAPRPLQQEAHATRRSYPIANGHVPVEKVRLRAMVGNNGIVKEVQVLSGNSDLAPAALREARNLRYGVSQVHAGTDEEAINITVNFDHDEVVSIVSASAY
jgi:hypothetical protein